jgi:uncharacterized RDD family membrane protein YckC
MKDYDLDSQHFVGFFPRFFAALIDSLILYSLYFIERYFLFHRFPMWFLSIFIVIWLCISYGYNPIFVGLKGWTPGKYLLRLRVINPQGEKIGLGRGLIRNIISFTTIYYSASLKFTLANFLIANPSVDNYAEAYKAINFPPTTNFLWCLPFMLFTIVDVCFLIFNSRHRALHDFMAGSFVIKIPKKIPKKITRS